MGNRKLILCLSLCFYYVFNYRGVFIENHTRLQKKETLCAIALLPNCIADFLYGSCLVFTNGVKIIEGFMLEMLFGDVPI